MTFFKKYKISRYRNPAIITLVLTALVYLSALQCDASFKGMMKGLEVGGKFMAGMFPPAWNELGDMIAPTLETIFIAFLATPLGVIAAFIMALFATNTISNPYTRHIFRFLFAMERALPEILVAYFFIAAFGIGPMPGIIALAIGCVGMLGRLFADAMEEVGYTRIEAIYSVGASWLQVIRYAILPETLPSLIANSLFRFEINIRNSTLLGAVGAGGIGYVLLEAWNLLDYPRMTAAIMVTLTLIFTTERLSFYLRKKVMTKGMLQ